MFKVIYFLIVFFMMAYSQLAKPNNCNSGNNLNLRSNELQGYTSKISYYPGDEVEFKVSSVAGFYDLQIVYLDGFREVLVQEEVTNISATQQPITPNAYKDGADWVTNFTYTIPDNWKPGLYAAIISDRNLPCQYITFIVKAKVGEESELLVLSATNTWQAYNTWGGSFGSSLYRIPGLDPDLPNGESKCGGDTTCNPFVHYQRPNRATPTNLNSDLIGGERHVLDWLRQKLQPYDLVSDVDVHRDPSLLNKYKAVLINGHAEYWTEKMYTGFESYLDQGGNVIYLTGNGIYWKTTIQGDQIEVRKRKQGQPHTEHTHANGGRGGLWRDLCKPEQEPNVECKPESKLTGVQFVNLAKAEFRPFKVLNASHWVFDGTNVSNGDLIAKKHFGRANCGKDEFGNDLYCGEGGSGWENDSTTIHSPPNIEIIARGENPTMPKAEITYYDHNGGGGVFSIGSLNIGRSLSIPHENPVLSKMLENVFSRFGIDIPEIPSIPKGAKGNINWLFKILEEKQQVQTNQQ